MEELIEYIEQSPRPGRAFKWKQPNILNFLPAPLKDSVSPNTWRKIYTKQPLQDAMATIHPVAFNVKQVSPSTCAHIYGWTRKYSRNYLLASAVTIMCITEDSTQQKLLLTLYA